MSPAHPHMRTVLHTLQRQQQGLVTAVKDIVKTQRKKSHLDAVAEAEAQLARQSVSEAQAPGTGVPGANHEKSLQELDAAANKAARRYNLLHLEAQKKQAELERLQLEYSALQKENADLGIEDTGGRPGSAASSTTSMSGTHLSNGPQARRIGMLAGLLDDTAQELAERQFKKEQYEYMVSRLKKNQVTFDSHIRSMEEALTATRKELADVRSYVRLLEQSKETAATELTEYQDAVARLQAKRKAELERRKSELDAAKKAEAWRRQREAVRQELKAQMSGDLSQEQEDALLATRQERHETLQRLQAERELRADEAAAMFEAFQRVRQATGATTLDELVEKFTSQAKSRRALEAEYESEVQDLEQLQQVLREANAELEQLKVAGDVSEDMLQVLRLRAAGKAASIESKCDSSDDDEHDVQPAAGSARLQRASTHESKRADLDAADEDDSAASDELGVHHEGKSGRADGDSLAPSSSAVSAAGVAMAASKDPLAEQRARFPDKVFPMPIEEVDQEPDLAAKLQASRRTSVRWAFDHVDLATVDLDALYIEDDDMERALLDRLHQQVGQERQALRGATQSSSVLEHALVSVAQGVRALHARLQPLEPMLGDLRPALTYARNTASAQGKRIGASNSGSSSAASGTRETTVATGAHVEPVDAPSAQEGTSAGSDEERHQLSIAVAAADAGAAAAHAADELTQDHNALGLSEETLQLLAAARTAPSLRAARGAGHATLTDNVYGMASNTHSELLGAEAVLRRLMALLASAAHGEPDSALYAIRQHWLGEELEGPALLTPQPQVEASVPKPRVAHARSGSAASGRSALEPASEPQMRPLLPRVATADSDATSVATSQQAGAIGGKAPLGRPGQPPLDSSRAGGPSRSTQLAARSSSSDDELDEVNRSNTRASLKAHARETLRKQREAAAALAAAEQAGIDDPEAVAAAEAAAAKARRTESRLEAMTSRPTATGMGSLLQKPDLL